MSQPHDEDGLRSVRRRISMVADLYVGGRRTDCRILEVSPDGARIEVASPPELRRRVRLDLGRPGSVDGIVAWHQDTCVGVRFLGDADPIVTYFSAETHRFSEPTDKRRFQRAGVLWSGQVAAGRQVHRCFVNDISAGGARIRLTEASVPNAQVTLKIDRLDSYPCTVVWRKYDAVGLEFQVPHGEMARKLGIVLPACRLIAA